MKRMLRTWAGRAVMGAVLAAGVVGGLGLVVAAPAAAADNGTVYVVHGLPGRTVDVDVNGKATLTGFRPGEVAGPPSLPAGSHDVTIRKAGDPDGSGNISAVGALMLGGLMLISTGGLVASRVRR
ncbi:MAG: DUF4397 domain-containing protein [Streptosporangiaceae bacterium]|nr:DUF4397 domain-containing protein [Streptosporangiaceae bacterium]